jgi:hypothetical protein
MNDPAERTNPEPLTGLRSWLHSTVSLSLPGWGVAAGALALVLLLLLALD